MTVTNAQHPIIALEMAALARWCSGDPDGFLEISAPEVVYFDPFIGQRIDGLPALAAYYDGLRGRIFANRYEMRSPLVQQIGDAAVLTFHFVSWGNEGREMRWNCTEVYRRSGERWVIVHTHWSLAGGEQAGTT